MSAILLESDIVHYEVLGRGRPVLFLHSWVGTWRYWIPSMQAVSAAYRAYAIDLWGFGDSAKNRKYRLDEQVQLLASFLDKLGIFRIAIVGHGLGALAALELAASSPEVVDRVVAVSVPLERNTTLAWPGSELSIEAMHEILDDVEDEGMIRDELHKNDPEALKAVSWQGLAASREDAFVDLNINSLFVHGRKDPLVPPPSGRVLDGLPENRHGLIFENSGHFPMLAESSKFNRLLQDFLALESGQSVRELQLKEEWKRRVR